MLTISRAGINMLDMKLNEVPGKTLSLHQLRITSGTHALQTPLASDYISSLPSPNVF